MNETGAPHPPRPGKQDRSGAEKGTDLNDLRSSGQQEAPPCKLSRFFTSGPAGYLFRKANVSLDLFQNVGHQSATLPHKGADSGGFATSHEHLVVNFTHSTNAGDRQDDDGHGMGV